MGRSDAFGQYAFLAGIEALRVRRRRSAGELSLREIAFDGPRFAKALSRAVRLGTYRPQPARAHVAFFDGRERTLYQSTAVDSVVERVVARWLQDELEPMFAESLWSYRRGRSSILAVRDFASFVRAHSAERSDPRTRGLFVIRRDVASYGSSIPNGDDSEIWTLLTEACRGAEALYALPLVRKFVQRSFVDLEGKTKQLAAGSPTGSSIQPFINNLFLTPLDRQLSKLPGYALRFGDDLLFASADAESARAAASCIDAHLRARGLAANPTKSRDLYFNGAGRRPPAAGFLGARGVELLGLEVSFAGSIRLPRRKQRALLNELRRRLRRSVVMARGDAGSTLARVSAAALDPAHALHAAEADALQHVDDREQLAQLDYLIALSIAQLCTRTRGPRAFRSLSIRTLRDHGLPSLLARRNER